jgi:Caudovirus prohead serine protease
MGEEAQPDFGGYATKAGLLCSDGRTIMPDAFKHQDGIQVPLVWQHGHNDPGNVLGHALLEHREDGMYARAFFNDTPQALNAKTLVRHKDITSLSIYANQLTEKGKQVFHGFIRELSLVLSGANPGALIDNVSVAHSDGEVVTLEDEAIIYTGEELVHDGLSENDENEPEVEHASDGPTVQDIYDSMTDDQKNVVHYFVGAALEEAAAAAAQSDDSTESLTHEDDSDKEGRRVTRNVFEQESEGKGQERPVLTHSDVKGIVEDAQKLGSLKAAVESYALAHGIENIELLFPDARNVTNTPEFDSRRVEWVSGVINGTKHLPFTRIKQLTADITFDEARARGYIKGNLKKEEFFGVARRTTTPTTVYKKQKLDRDDIIDITDFDVVVWLKQEMRLMLDEELARAILIGDGRDVADDDKIKDPAGAAAGDGVRSILYEHDLYAATVTIDDAAASTEVVDAVISAMQFYKGSGSPTFYTTLPTITKLLLTRDSFGHRLWKNASELASEMGCSSIVAVEVMEGETDLIGIIVNLNDYSVGTDQGGEVNFFDFFDIDYNQYKYLYETRLSGALTKIRSALVVKRAKAGDTLVTPTAPTFDGTTVTIPTVTGVAYTDQADNSALTGSVAVAAGDSLTVQANPTSGHYFANNVDDQWTFNNVS